MPQHYQIIQAAHATQEIIKETEHPDKTSHFILFEAKDENDLKRIKLKLDDKGIKAHMFFEPDTNEFTSICCEPQYGKDRNYFKKFHMYRCG